MKSRARREASRPWLYDGEWVVMTDRHHGHSFFVACDTLGTKHRLLKLRTDGGYARVHELGSIDFVL